MFSSLNPFRAPQSLKNSPAQHIKARQELQHKEVSQLVQKIQTAEAQGKPVNAVVKAKAYSQLAALQDTQVLKEFTQNFAHIEKEVLDGINANVSLTKEQIAEVKSFITLENLHNTIKQIRSLTSQAGENITSLFPSSLPSKGSVLLTALIGIAFQAQFVAAAQSYEPHQGSPAGGLDLCAGTILGCVQGYATPVVNGTSQGWTTATPQYNRRVDTVGSDPSTSSREQLRTCMTLEKVYGLVVQALAHSAEGETQMCFGKSTVWNGYQLSSTTTALTPAQCQAYKDLFSFESQSCMSAVGAFLSGAKIAGIVIGAVVGAAALAVLGCCLYTKYSKSTSDSKNMASRNFDYVAQNNV